MGKLCDSKSQNKSELDHIRPIKDIAGLLNRIDKEGVFIPDKAAHIGCPNCLPPQECIFRRFEIPPHENLEFQDESGESLIVFLLSGSASINLRGEGRIPIKGGQFICIVSGSKYSLETQTQTTVIIMRYPGGELCEAVSLSTIRDLIETSPSDYAPEEIAPMLELFIRSVELYIENGISCRHIHRTKATECLFLIRILYSKKQLANVFAPVMVNDFMLKYKIIAVGMHVRMAQELADKCGISYSSLYRKMKEFFGMTPAKWLSLQIDRRIIVGLKSEASIKSVCFSLGFDSLQNFSAYCKKTFGMSPSALKKLEYHKIEALKREIETRMNCSERNI